LILTRGEASIQLTYTPDEYEEFNRAAVAFRNEITGTLQKEIVKFRGDSREYWDTFVREFVEMLDSIDHVTITTRVEPGFQLTFGVEQFTTFDNNIGFLSLDLLGLQEGYEGRGEYDKCNALENLQHLVNAFVRLLGNKQILDS
jgi:hypothetical protein